MAKEIKRIAVLTSGGDAPGMNAAVRAIVRNAIHNDLHIYGFIRGFEGMINARQDVYVAEEADVDATITAGNVVIAGLAKGTIRCEDRFEVLPSGRVSGDIMAPVLVVQ